MPADSGFITLHQCSTNADKFQWLFCDFSEISSGYAHLYILLQQRDQQTRNEITVTGYQTRLNYADSIFSFDKKQYPNAEIIDLR